MQAIKAVVRADVNEDRPCFAVTSSILPVANAFLVLLLFTCIYAVIAVTLFQVRHLFPSLGFFFS